MIIREAVKDDVEQILDLVHEFQKESIDKYNVFCDDKIAREYISNNLKAALVMLKDNKIIGLIAGTIVNYPLNLKPMYQETMWFMTKEYRKYGVKLLKELERRLKLANINQMVIAHMSNCKSEKLERFYNRCGFELMEMQYFKTL